MFLDANILCSAALTRSQGQAACDVLWQLAAMGRVELVTGACCHLEAERNLQRKYPDAVANLGHRMQRVRIRFASAAAGDLPAWAGHLRAKDRPVMAAALACRADVLVTGDTRDFGPLMGREDIPVRVMTLRTFLSQWPPDRSG